MLSTGGLTRHLHRHPRVPTPKSRWRHCSLCLQSIFVLPVAVSARYTAKQNYKQVNRIVDDFVDIVSKNGCLLLNIGPKKDGTIPEEEQRMLKDIGAWLKINGEAIYKSRPFAVFGEGPTGTVTGHLSENKNKPYVSEDFRYTANNDCVYAFVLDKPENGKVLFKSLGKSAGHLQNDVRQVTLLGHEGDIQWSQTDDHLSVQLPENDPCNFVLVLKVQ